MNKTILIVDDEQSICTTLRRFFRGQGFDTICAYNGLSTLEICDSRAIDVVLLDLRLPDMDGLEILRRIKADSPSTSVIVITAHGDVKTAVKAIQMRADNFLLKPIDLNVLGAIVDKSIETYRTQVEIQSLRGKVANLEATNYPPHLQQPGKIYSAINLMAENASTTVLLLGETGTGKGLNQERSRSRRSHHPRNRWTEVC